MKRLILLMIFMTISLVGCQNKTDKTASVCTEACEAKNKDAKVACKLTTPELQKRKETVLASLKNQIIEKKELADGFAFKFAGSDKMIDELTEFIKTERACCDFFTFNLSVSGDQSETWLQIKGKNGAKDFIEAEMGL